MKFSELNHAYYRDDNTILYHGKNTQILQDIPSDFVDLLATDPSYGIHFMQNHWDIDVPPVQTWQECYRVLKPGAFAFIFSSSRQDVLAEMIVRLRQAGFDTNFTSLYWTYAAGFPKAGNISKMVDKKLGQEREIIGQKKLNHNDKKVYTPNVYEGINGTSTFEKNPGMNMVTAPSSNQAKELDGAYTGFQPKPAVEVIIVAMKPLSVLKRSDFFNRDGIDYFYTSNTTIPETKARQLNEKYNIQAKVGDNLKTRIALNPELDDEMLLNDVVFNRKPYKDTDLSGYASQALWNRKGITWMDDCRIPYQSDNDMEGARYGSQANIKGGNLMTPKGVLAKNVLSSPEGRFPANLLVSDDVLNDGMPCGGNGHFNSKVAMVGHTLYEGGFKDFQQKERHLDEAGSYSRYFDLDKWWEERIKSLPKEVQETLPYLIVSKPSKSERNDGLEHHLIETDDGLTGNFHPTVKPLKIWDYILTLGSREGDICLDPFCGSGTLNVSAKALNRKSIGIDWEEDYLKRIAVPKMMELSKQRKLFQFT